MEKGQRIVSLSLGSSPNLDASGQAKSDSNSYMGIREFFANLGARNPEVAEKLAVMLCAELEQYRNPVVEEGFDEIPVEQEQEQSEPHPDEGTW